MPLYTFKHCLICYADGTGSMIEKDASSVQNLNKHAEICRRFCTLSSRYFDLDPFHFAPAKTINTKRTFLYDQVCDKCVDLLKSFCDIYQQWEYLELQLKWRAHEIALVMKGADQKGQNREILEGKLKNVDSSMVEIDDFRTDFIDTVTAMRAKPNPIVKVEKHRTEYHDDDDDFIEVKVIVPKKERRKRDLEQTLPTQHTSRVNIENTIFSIEKTTMMPGSCTSSDLYSTTSEDGKDDECGRKAQHVAKRPKVSKEPALTVMTDDEPDSSSECEGEEEQEDNTKCESSQSDKNTVIILTDKTNNVNGILKYSVNKYEDDILHVRGEETSVNCLKNEDKDITTRRKKSLILPSHHNENINNENSHKLNNNGYYNNQFNHLQYICPFPSCGTKFKTMTRMMVHQRVTGHHFNAVINIVK